LVATSSREAGAAASAVRSYRLQIAKTDEVAEFVRSNIVQADGKHLSRYQIEERFLAVNDGKKLPDENTIFRDYMASEGFVYDGSLKKTVHGRKVSGCYKNCALTN
jgi:hypothetical protein